MGTDPSGAAVPTRDRPSSRARKALRLCAGVFAVVLLIGAGFMAGYSPRFRRALIGWGDYDLTVVHTNDTWGYLDACG